MKHLYNNPSKLFWIIMIFGLFQALIISCTDKDNAYDASGSFEAVETIISAEATGTIEAFNIEEGQILKAGEIVGFIDSTQLTLKKKQLEAQIKAMGSRLPDIIIQTGYYKQQLAALQVRFDNLKREQIRIQNLVKAEAATLKQLDDINAQVDESEKQLMVIKKQDAAQVSALNTQSSGLRSDVLPLLAQIEQLNDQISKCRIINGPAGTVLTKYAEANEMAATGKPLYKVADLSTLILRAYITGDQLAKVKINQKADVMIDTGNDSVKHFNGTVEWISDKAEFTPKTIQTRDERANLVYAVKIRVLNDGALKLGMYADVKF